MKENKTMDQLHRAALKKFHTLCSLLGIREEEKHFIVQSYGVESSRDLDTHSLIDLCAALSERQNSDLDVLRKRTIAAIGAYLRSQGKASSLTLIKQIACRSTGHKNFNRIPRERLRNIIATFNNKVSDKRNVEHLKREISTLPDMPRSITHPQAIC